MVKHNLPSPDMQPAQTAGRLSIKRRLKASINNAKGFRFLGLFVALLMGIGGPLFLLGPFLINGLSFESISAWAKSGSIVCLLLGAWCLAVAAFAESKTVEEVFSQLSAAEGALFALPYMFFAGTKGLWEKFFEKNEK